MSSSRIPQAVDALVALLDDALDIEVTDGALLQNQERAGLTVGADVEESRFPWEQDWVGLGHVSRDETFEVPCVLWVRTGDTEAVSDTRAEAFGYFADIESALRTSEDLGLDGAYNVRADVRPTAYAQPQTDSGLVCRIDFRIRIQARI